MGSAICCSADGQVMAAAGWRDATGEFAGNVYVSTNGGARWFTSSPFKSWVSICCSADGTQIAGACATRRSFGAGILLSPDCGLSWTGTGAANDTWMAITSSANGGQLVAADAFTGSIYTSDDGAVSWITHTPQPQGFMALASSADGTALIAVSDALVTPGGPIYVSTNGGRNWIQTPAPLTNWSTVACSGDASRLVAAGGGTTALGRLHTSDDFGQTWTLAAGTTLAHWTSVACSADGTKMAATAYGGHIYTRQTSPFSLSPTLKLSRGKGSAVVSWVVPSMRFKLQSTSDLGNPGAWVDVTQPPSLTNVEYQVAPPPATSGYFRLISE